MAEIETIEQRVTSQSRLNRPVPNQPPTPPPPPHQPTHNTHARRLFGDLALAGAASNPHGTVTQLRRLLAQVPPDLLPPAATDDVEEGPEDGEGQGKAAGGEEEEEGGDDDILLPAPFGDGVVEPLLQDPCGRGGPKVGGKSVSRVVKGGHGWPP